MIKCLLDSFTTAGLLCVAFLAGCVTKDGAGGAGGFLGSWDCGPVKTEMGTIMVRIEISEQGNLTATLKPMFHERVPKVLGSGPYRIEHGVLLSSVLPHSRIKLVCDGSELLLEEEGEPARRFSRAKRGGWWDAGPTIETLRVAVWSARPFELPSQLPNTEAWRPGGAEQVFDGDGWQVRVVCAPDRPDANVVGVLPSASYVAYITLEPISASPVAYRMFTNVTTRLVQETGGVWVDLLGAVRTQDDAAF